MIVSADPATANVARMVTYRPLPGQSAKTVTVTVKILSRPSGEGKDYDSMTVLASKDITLTVQPLTQDELDAASAFMTKVCTEDVYWEGHPQGKQRPRPHHRRHALVHRDRPGRRRL